jgi:hypothetical protein
MGGQFQAICKTPWEIMNKMTRRSRIMDAYKPARRKFRFRRLAVCVQTSPSPFRSRAGVALYFLRPITDQISSQ